MNDAGLTNVDHRSGGASAPAENANAAPVSRPQPSNTLSPAEHTAFLGDFADWARAVAGKPGGRQGHMTKWGYVPIVAPGSSSSCADLWDRNVRLSSPTEYGGPLAERRIIDRHRRYFEDLAEDRLIQVNDWGTGGYDPMHTKTIPALFALSRGAIDCHYVGIDRYPDWANGAAVQVAKEVPTVSSTSSITADFSDDFDLKIPADHTSIDLMLGLTAAQYLLEPTKQFLPDPEAFKNQPSFEQLLMHMGKLGNNFSNIIVLTVYAEKHGPSARATARSEYYSDFKNEFIGISEHLIGRNDPRLNIMVDDGASLKDALIWDPQYHEKGLGTVLSYRTDISMSLGIGDERLRITAGGPSSRWIQGYHQTRNTEDMLGACERIGNKYMVANELGDGSSPYRAIVLVGQNVSRDLIAKAASPYFAREIFQQTSRTFTERRPQAISVAPVDADDDDRVSSLLSSGANAFPPAVAMADAPETAVHAFHRPLDVKVTEPGVAWELAND